MLLVKDQNIFIFYYLHVPDDLGQFEYFLLHQVRFSRQLIIETSSKTRKLNPVANSGSRHHHEIFFQEQH